MNPSIEPPEFFACCIGDGFDLCKISRVRHNIKCFAAVCLDFFN